LLEYILVCFTLNVSVEESGDANLGAVDLFNGDFTQQEVDFVSRVERADELRICRRYTGKKLVHTRLPSVADPGSWQLACR